MNNKDVEYKLTEIRDYLINKCEDKQKVHRLIRSLLGMLWELEKVSEK